MNDQPIALLRALQRNAAQNAAAPQPASSPQRAASAPSRPSSLSSYFQAPVSLRRCCSLRKKSMNRSENRDECHIFISGRFRVSPGSLWAVRPLERVSWMRMCWQKQRR